jgi:hypothetical protein
MTQAKGRVFCSAKCATADCYRRWTAELQATVDPRLSPVEFVNFSKNCLVYSPPKRVRIGTALKHGEVNK